MKGEEIGTFFFSSLLDFEVATGEKGNNKALE